MSGTHIERSQSTPKAAEGVQWTATQAYLLAVFCLLLGVALGYLFRGSASPAQAAVAPVQATESANEKQVAAQAALTQATAPLIDAVNRNPEDYNSLVELGNLYYDAQQYPSAIQYYDKALLLHPDNPDVRTDMGTAYWYSGNADRALTELEKSLKFRPEHPQTLFNLGWIRWQGKADPKGAVAAWEKLLQANPNYPQKQLVEQYIKKAKEHAAKG